MTQTDNTFLIIDYHMHHAVNFSATITNTDIPIVLAKASDLFT